MATEGFIIKQSSTAAADYSSAASQFKIVKLDTSGTVTIISTLGARGDAVLVNKPAAGQVAELVEHGFAKAQVGAAVASAGLELTPDATGRLVAASTGNFVFAISREAASAAGEIIGIKICGPYVK